MMLKFMNHVMYDRLVKVQIVVVLDMVRVKVLVEVGPASIVVRDQFFMMIIIFIMMVVLISVMIIFKEWLMLLNSLMSSAAAAVMEFSELEREWMVFFYVLSMGVLLGHHILNYRCMVELLSWFFDNLLFLDNNRGMLMIVIVIVIIIIIVIMVIIVIMFDIVAMCVKVIVVVIVIIVIVPDIVAMCVKVTVIVIVIVIVIMVIIIMVMIVVNNVVDRTPLYLRLLTLKLRIVPWFKVIALVIRVNHPMTVLMNNLWHHQLFIVIIIIMFMVMLLVFILLVMLIIFLIECHYRMRINSSIVSCSR